VELAGLIGVSQSKISRIEKLSGIHDVALATKLSGPLRIELTDLLSASARQGLHQSSADNFFAFCPNPLCRSNETKKLSDGKFSTTWKSGRRYPHAQFLQTNFCGRCGTELVKQCSNCERKFTDEHTRFCIACGHAATERPSVADMAEIEEVFKDAIAEEDLPF